MGCIDGIDPADFQSGVLDPGDVASPGGYELSISYDDTIDDFFAAGYVQFEVNVSPIDYIDGVGFDFSTSDGTAVAGTHYTARTGVHVSVAAGVGLYIGQINILKSDSFHGDKTFVVTISNPVNATIADATATLIIHYEPKQPPTDPADLPHFDSWPEHRTVYDQFHGIYYGACTAFAATAGITAQEYLDKGTKVAFDPERFWVGDGQIASQIVALKYAVSNGAWTASGSRTRKIAKYSTIDGSDKEDMIKRIKRNIYNYGPVYCCCIWYSQYRAGNNTSMDWNTIGSHANVHNILPNPADHGNLQSCLGHAVIITGWDNNIAGTGIGGFQIQSSHGGRWGHHGRSWLTYRTINTHKVRWNTHGTCDGSNGPAGNLISDPWFQFFRMELIRGG